MNEKIKAFEAWLESKPGNTIPRESFFAGWDACQAKMAPLIGTPIIVEQTVCGHTVPTLSVSFRDEPTTLNRFVGDLLDAGWIARFDLKYEGATQLYCRWFGIPSDSPSASITD